MQQGAAMWQAAQQARAAAEYCVRWGVTPDGGAMVTDHGYLLPVRRGGEALMLKLSDPGDDEAAAGDFLALLGGRGAVRVMEHAPAVVLMERIAHGGPRLEKMALEGQDDAAVHILCDVIAEIHAGLAGAVLPGLIPLDQRIAHVAGHGGDGRLPAGLRAVMRWAEAHVGERIAERDGWRALHGDLHHFNVVCDRSRGWLAIDPKGILGPALYDYAVLCLNPLPHAELVHDPAPMARVVDIVAERTTAQRGDVLGWVVFQACLSLAWSLHDEERDFWLGALRTAAALADMPLPG
jgi:streptomycin 6-kinase